MRPRFCGLGATLMSRLAAADAKDGKDAKKATMRIVGLDEAWAGTFRLFAFEKGHEDGAKVVMAAVPEVNATVPFLWFEFSFSPMISVVEESVSPG